MATYPVLRQPTFFSSQLNDYIEKISTQTGRHIIYIDARGANRSNAQAWIEYTSDLPVAAVFVNIGEINPLRYEPQFHDPLIAHEVTHLQLFSEGWSPVSWDEGCDQPSIDKITAVANWLTDPIINQRISRIGFNMAANRIYEIETSTAALEKGLWSAYQKDKGLSDIQPIRFFVSFCLEPQIPDALKVSFQEAFRQDLPDSFGKASGFLQLIEANGFDTPEKYKRTALLCLRQWQVQTDTIKFAEFRRCTLEEQENWLEANIDADDNRDWV